LVGDGDVQWWFGSRVISGGLVGEDGHTVCKVGTLDVGAGVGALVGGGGGARLAHKVLG